MSTISLTQASFIALEKENQAASPVTSERLFTRVTGAPIHLKEKQNAVALQVEEAFMQAEAAKRFAPLSFSSNLIQAKAKHPSNDRSNFIDSLRSPSRSANGSPTQEEACHLLHPFVGGASPSPISAYVISRPGSVLDSPIESTSSPLVKIRLVDCGWNKVEEK